MLVTLAIMMLLIMITGPPLMKYMQRTKLTALVNQTSATMRLARIQAIKRSSWAVVRTRPSVFPPQVIAFADLDRDGRQDPEDPILANVLLEKGITFIGSDAFSPDPENASLPKMVIFQENGSAFDAGAFRFRDAKGNEMEIRVVQAATGRIEIRKNEGGVWRAAGEGGQQWTWK